MWPAPARIKERNQAALDSLLEDIMVAPFEVGAARAYGPLRTANRERNKNALDKLIAAHAMAMSVTLMNSSQQIAAETAALANRLNETQFRLDMTQMTAFLTMLNMPVDRTAEADKRLVRLMTVKAPWLVTNDDLTCDACPWAIATR